MTSTVTGPRSWACTTPSTISPPKGRSCRARVEQPALSDDPILQHGLQLPNSWWEDLAGTLGRVSAADTDRVAVRQQYMDRSASSSADADCGRGGTDEAKAITDIPVTAGLAVASMAQDVPEVKGITKRWE
ncbi:hypothetical protein [Streptomyces torulosus]|uniref:hypothetical protein n=1 Tax=Streptomyces torulosus TaxID=68276 RepID=UPI0007C6F2DC|nr:hypothetical protein [Streptomyces torulosus]